MYGRLRSSHTGRRFPLVLVLDKSRPPQTVARSVLALCTDWTRLCVRNLAAVVTWLQTRGKSGRFEVEAFGARGTIFLHDGELIEARWKELEGREVVRFFAEELPDSGFRFAEIAGPASHEERALEVPAPAVPSLPADRTGSTPVFGPVRTALVRLQLEPGGTLRRTGASPAGDGTALTRAASANGGPPPGAHANGAGVHGARANGAHPSGVDPRAGRTAAPAPGAAVDVNGGGPPTTESRRAAPAPRRPAFLVRAIWRAERERLLTGTGPAV
ncbi:MAG TPA: DUF4388 domain-containing protein [Gemmatimonadota bacterium]